MKRSDPDKKRARVLGGELAYIDEGDLASPAVVLLHGFPTSSFLWRDFVPLLAPWFRVVAPDLLGYGDSEKPENAELLNPRAQARYVRELTEQLGIGRFAVVGHDIGGAVAQLLALEGVVGAMVLFDSVAFDAWPADAVKAIQRTPQEGEREEVLAAFETFFDLGIGHPDRMTGELIAAYRAPFESPEGVRAFFRAARGIDGAGLAGREAELERLDCPVLIVWGEDDPFLPAPLADRLSQAIPTSTLALLPGCSHFVTEDAPEAIGPLLYEYLRSRYLGLGHGHAEHAGLVTVQLERRPPSRNEGGS